MGELFQPPHGDRQAFDGPPMRSEEVREVATGLLGENIEWTGSTFKHRSGETARRGLEDPGHVEASLQHRTEQRLIVDRQGNVVKLLGE